MDKNSPKVNKILTNVVLPIHNYISNLELSGIILLAVTVVSLILANGPSGEAFLHFWHSPLGITIGSLKLEGTVHFFINDILMTFFFIVVGGEIKREIVEGALSSKEKAILPIIAAIGGMFFPGMIYVLFNIGQPSLSGWGIPTATDIAFSLTIISLLGKRVPFSIKIFLAALAIADDLGAIVVIALFYSTSLQWTYLLFAVGVMVILFGMNYQGTKSLKLYAFFGAILWYLFFKAGIHPTIAGVIFAMSIPFTSKRWEEDIEPGLIEIKHALDHLNSEHGQDKLIRDELIDKIQNTAEGINTPLQNLLEQLHPYSNYIIMPLFAFANAGVIINTDAITSLGSAVSLGIIFGLMLGKSTGIWLACLIATKLKLGKIPEDVTWKHIYGMGWVAGIGFTMSMFVTELAFTNEAYIDTAKIAILLASTLSGLVGYLVLFFIDSVEKKKKTEAEDRVGILTEH